LEPSVSLDLFLVGVFTENIRKHSYFLGQLVQGLADEGYTPTTTGYGAVGPRTRAKLNAL
jgi:hypothetical protein